jgi:hypothetical protein
LLELTSGRLRCGVFQRAARRTALTVRAVGWHGRIPPPVPGGGRRRFGDGAWLVTFSAFTGRGLLEALELVAAPFVRHSALEPGLGSALVGLLVHLAVSAALGVLFAAILHAT